MNKNENCVWGVRVTESHDPIKKFRIKNEIS